MSPDSLLQVLAELAESTTTRAPTDVLGGSNDFVVQRTTTGSTWLFADGNHEVSLQDVARGRQSAKVDAMISRDALHRHEQILRVGWLWFSGTVLENEKEVRYFFPVVSVPVVVNTDFGTAITGDRQVMAIGDAEITPLITDQTLRDQLLGQIEMGGGALSRTGARPDNRLLDRLPKLRSWSNAASDGVGISVDDHLIIGEVDPLYRRGQSGIAAFYCLGLYIDNKSTHFGRSDALRQLTELGELQNTAFSKLYWPGAQTEPAEPVAPQPNIRVRPLSHRQASVLQAARSTAVSTITGAPGSGKSHVLASLAIDAIADGKSVLVIASSPHAVDVLVEHFQRTPGAVPVAFGGSRHGNRLADELLELRSKAIIQPSDWVGDGEYEGLRSSIDELLQTEREAASFSVDSAVRLRVMESLERAGDLEELDSLIERTSSSGLRGLLGRRHRSAVAHRLGMSEFDSDAARLSFDGLRRSDQVRRLAFVDGLDLEPSLAKLVASEQGYFAANGRRITHDRYTKRRRNAANVVGSVAMGLRSDRASRRRLFAEIPSDELVDAVPLWIGVAKDVADVLPPAAGMFDLLIIDEAGQLDQLSAAHALVRGADVIACGDNNQLGFVSFLSDDQVAEASERHGLDLRVDPRRQSVLDLASAAGPTYQLTEHFRSVPHLIEFSSRHFYGRQVEVVTRRPENESADHIDVYVVDGGTRGPDKSNAAEVDVAMRLIRESVDQGWRSIGVVSPFRAQADAVEKAIIDAYRPEEIIKYGLRVGTVHGFQGDERDLLIMTWAIGADEGGSPWRFVNQRDLFNVMVSRAREHVMVVTSVPEPPGLAGDYVQWSVPLENLIDDVGSLDPWVRHVAEACRDAGIPTRVGYPVGPHVIDLVVGDRDNAVAVDCVPHDGGTVAHLDRALLLRRGGWRTADAYQSRWHDRVGELALKLARMVDAAD